MKTSRPSFSWRSITESRLFFPLLAIAIILLFDLIFEPGFFKLETMNGHLYGSIIDVLRNGACIMLLAIGMTLVIATGGVDLSVGAVMAISASVAALMMNPYVLATELPPNLAKLLFDPNFTYAPLWAGDHRDAGRSPPSAACGTACWSPTEESRRWSPR